MNILDRTIAAISPRWAYKRKAWSAARSSLYDSASTGRENYSWNPKSGFKENMLGMERKRIIARAQDMERNSDILCSILSAFDRHAVGNGITLQSKVDDTELSKKLEDLWKEFGKARNCDTA